MSNKVTISLEEHVYDELCRAAGSIGLSDYIETLLRPRESLDLEEGYRSIAADHEREAEAVEWMEGTAEAIVDAEG